MEPLCYPQQNNHNTAITTMLGSAACINYNIITTPPHRIRPILHHAICLHGLSHDAVQRSFFLMPIECVTMETKPFSLISLGYNECGVTLYLETKSCGVCLCKTVHGSHTEYRGIIV